MQQNISWWQSCAIRGRLRHYLVGAIVSGLFCWPLMAVAQANDYPVDALMRTPVLVDVKAASPDEHLLAIARAADVNFFADATEMPVPVTKSDEKSDYILWGTLLQFVDKHGLRVQRFGERNFLLWPTPNTDITEVARQISAERMLQRAQNPASKMDKESRETLLAQYLRGKGWDGNWEKVDITVKWAELPDNVRSVIEWEVQDLIEAVYDSKKFDENTWQKARLRLLNTAKKPGEYAPVLEAVIETPDTGGAMVWRFSSVRAARR